MGYTRRQVIIAASGLAGVPQSALAAEPVPAPTCDDACMAERVARKQALLAQQDRKSKAGATAIFGADWQKGVREDLKKAGSNPFLLPTDVGGVNLQRK